jgi:hypothetical protein
MQRLMTVFAMLMLVVMTGCVTKYDDIVNYETFFRRFSNPRNAR